MPATKKGIAGVVFGLLSLILLCSAAHAAYSQNFTVYGVNNAGTAWDEDHYAKIDGYANSDLTIPKHITVTDATPAFTGWTTGAHPVLTYTTTAPNIIHGWAMTSAGDIWDSSSHDQIAQSTGILSAGTYRISVLSTTDAFAFDTWNWSPYYGYWGWYLQITDNHGNHYHLGYGNATTNYADVVVDSNKADLLAAVQGLSIDIPVLAGTELYFWIYDGNTLDNGGSLSFNVASAPLPSSLLLALGGLPAMALFRMRRHMRHK